MPLYNPEMGLISTIQKYSTKDGPGIRDTVFFKGCPLGCLWCSNPELIRPVPDLLYTREKCERCGTCIKVCPNGALAFGADGFILVDHERCNGCGDCANACPHRALERIGQLVGVDELVKELLKDEIFYQTSGGGVTFSGGEPLWQSGFVARVARRLKDTDVHTALDTAGDVPWCRFEEVLGFIDLVLFDLKTMDVEKHRRYTGRENDLILENVRMLAQHGVTLHIRLIVVPGINDDEKDIRARMDFMHDLGSVKQVDILPYHRYGVGKYARLGLYFGLKELEEPSPEQIEGIQAMVEEYGVKVTVGG